MNAVVTYWLSQARPGHEGMAYQIIHSTAPDIQDLFRFHLEYMEHVLLDSVPSHSKAGHETTHTILGFKTLTGRAPRPGDMADENGVLLLYRPGNFLRFRPGKVSFPADGVIGYAPPSLTSAVILLFGQSLIDAGREYQGAIADAARDLQGQCTAFSLHDFSLPKMEE